MLFYTITALGYDLAMPHHFVHPARSVSLALPQSPDHPRPLRVLSVHRRALNLLDDAGNIIAVVTPEVGNGPFHIVLTHSLAFDFAAPGQDGFWQGTSLTLADHRIEWARARFWNPGLTPVFISQPALAALRDCMQEASAFQDRWKGIDKRTMLRMQSGVESIVRGLKDGERETLRRGVSRLIGLGPGLTPAGDDVLLGMLARLWLDAAQPAATGLGQCARDAAAMTTRISRAWLQHAARGQFDARWHALQAALLIADDTAICDAAHRILNVGASSGPQAMAGFLLT